MSKVRSQKAADSDPREELRKTAESIEVDFDELKANFLTLKEIEVNLYGLQKSQEIVKKILEEIKSFGDLYSKEISRFRNGIFDMQQLRKANN